MLPIRQLFQQARPLVVAHKGASGQAPENTMAAFRLALEQGADSIELDVHLSRDEVPVVIHDDTLERTTSGMGLVKDMAVAELKALDAGSWFAPQFAGEQVPTLEEVLAWAAGKAALNIEVKNLPMRYQGIVARIADLVAKHRMEQFVEVFSFDHTCIKELKAISPEILGGVCYTADPVDHSVLARLANAEVLHPHWHSLQSQQVSFIQAAGLHIVTWTVDEPGDAARLARMGVDGITTNYPLNIRLLLKGHGSTPQSS